MIRLRTQWMLALVFAVVASSCEVHDVTMVELRAVSLKKVEQTEMYIDVTAVLDNPNSFKINVTGTDMDLYLEGRYMGKATLQNDVTLSKKSSEAYELEIKVKGENLNAELLPILLSAALTGKVTVRLKGEVKGRVLFIGKAVPIDVEQVVEFNQQRN